MASERKAWCALWTLVVASYCKCPVTQKCLKADAIARISVLNGDAFAGKPEVFNLQASRQQVLLNPIGFHPV